MVPCVRVRIRVPEPHVSVQELHTDQSAHPSVVIATAVSTVDIAGTPVGPSHGTMVPMIHGTAVVAPLIYKIIL